MSTTPNRIGRYELEQYLGGGMSDVYRALDPQMGRTVVLKILKEAFRPDDPIAQRFVLEVQIAGGLNHDNVIRTYDFGFGPDGRPYMVLEYVEGEDLQRAIAAGRTGSLAERALIGVQLADALEYIHPRNVVHRDLKPANVYLSAAQQGSGPRVKLMDFGIARTENVSLTQAGMTLGTPAYMAPEQVRGEQVTKAVDIYAFGVVLWELFTGERAFAGDSLERVFYRALSEELDLGKLRQHGVPEDLTLQIGKCAAKEAWKRPADLRAIRLELQRLANPGAASELPAPPSQTPTLLIPAVTPVVPAPAPAGRPSPPLPLGPAPVDAATRPPWLWPVVGSLAGLAIVALVFMVSGGGNGGPAAKAKQGGAAQLAPRIETPTGAMLLVPAGAFQFGKAKESIEIPTFYVDRTEVTNQAFGEFARATGASLPAAFDPEKPNLPVVNVSFVEAQAFAEWAGKALPTSKQWEKAARGLDGRTYPWGEAAESNRANVLADKPGGLTPVDGFPDGASPFQVLQTVGNAWEWIDETAAPSPENEAAFAVRLKPPPAPGERWVRIRGSSFLEKLDSKVMYDGVTMPIRLRHHAIGFRCVKPVHGE